MYLHLFLDCVLLQYPYSNKMCFGYKTIKTYQIDFLNEFQTTYLQKMCQLAITNFVMNWFDCLNDP